MGKDVVKIITWIYGVIGGVLLLICLPMLYFNYIDFRGGGDLKGLVLADLLYFVFLMIGAFIFILISFAFYKLKRWGRYLAIGYNFFLIAIFIWILSSLWHDFPGEPKANILFAFSALVVIVMGAITGFCFSKGSKDLMSN